MRCINTNSRKAHCAFDISETLNVSVNVTSNVTKGHIRERELQSPDRRPTTGKDQQPNVQIRWRRTAS